MRCLNCFNEYDESFGLCPKCGVSQVSKRKPNDMAPGTLLHNRYVIGQSIGNGGFGIVYKAWDERLKSVVAIKEFYPKKIVTRNGDTGAVVVTPGNEDEFYYRKSRFIAEDKITAEFRVHKNIVTEYDCFECNNTVYMVMEFFAGESLATLLDNGERFTEDEALKIIYEVANALSAIHNVGVVHRDVSPDNIFIMRKPEFRVILLDFGAAKLVDYVAPVTDIMLKTGYSPLEQYKDMDSTNFSSDVYSLAATLYKILTNVEPMDALKREEIDDLKEPDTINSEISSSVNNTIMHALKLDSNERISSISEFVSELQMKPIKRITSNSKVMVKNNGKAKKTILISLVSIIVLCFCVFLYFYLFSPKTAKWLCKHKYVDPTCTEAQTCMRCGNVIGSPEGHQWVDATCTEPKTCKVCGETKGNVKGHQWKEATCTTPKTCIVCGLTAGTTSDHKWLAATCTTPMTCEVCGETTGNKTEHIWNKATCTTAKRCTLCYKTEGEALGHNYKNYICENCGAQNVTKSDLKKIITCKQKDYRIVGSSTRVWISFTNKSKKKISKISFTFNLYDKNSNFIKSFSNCTYDHTLKSKKTTPKGVCWNFNYKFPSQWRYSITNVQIYYSDGSYLDLSGFSFY